MTNKNLSFKETEVDFLSKIVSGILVYAVQLNSIVTMNAGGHAGCAGCANDITFFDFIPCVDVQFVTVGIKGCKTVSVVDHHIIAKFGVECGGCYSAGCGCINGDDLAFCGDIHTIMLSAVADAGISSGVEFGRNDSAFHRPAGGNVILFFQSSIDFVGKHHKGNICFIHQSIDSDQMIGREAVFVVGCDDNFCESGICGICGHRSFGSGCLFV